MRYIIALALALLLMVTCTMALGSTLAHAGTPTPAKCTEDMSCWSWSTMGNRSRGIVTMHGTPMVVGPCRFKRLMNGGMIDYRTSDVMRGDRPAMRMRCR